MLSVERLGGVSFAQSVSTWASALCLLGVNVYGVRECARVRDDARELALVVKELLVIIAAATSVVVIGFAAAIFVVPSFASVAPLMWMFLVETPVLPCGIECFYRGGERCACITVSSLAFKMLAFAGAVTPVRIVGAVSLMSCVSCFVAMGILSPLGRERRMAMPSIAAAPVSVVLNLLLDGPFGEVGAGVALLAAEATVLRIELWCARDVLSSFVRPRDLARMAASNAVAAAGVRGLRMVARDRVLRRSRSDRNRGPVGLQCRRHRRRSCPARRHGPHAGRKGPRGLATRVAWARA